MSYSIEGFVYLAGHSDHSGTEVLLSGITVPSLGFAAVFLLVSLLSFLLLKKFRSRVAILFCSIVFFLPGSNGALFQYTVMNQSDGRFIIEIPSDQVVKSGKYFLSFSHLGYEEKRVIIFIPASSAVVTVAEQTLHPVDYHAGDAVGLTEIGGILRYIPATGEEGFIQGTPEDEPCEWWPGSSIQFTHVMTRPYLILEHEVTQSMWLALHDAMPDEIGPDPSNPVYGFGPNYPAQNVQWYDLLLFCNVLSRYAGLKPSYYIDEKLTISLDMTNFLNGPYFWDRAANGYRLPTESEWEYACRAGTATQFYLDEPNYNWSTCQSCEADVLPILSSIAVFCYQQPFGSSLPVKSKLPNAWNIYDMHGNVWEWCWDPGADYPEEKAVDWVGEAPGFWRIYRGGSWFAGRPLFCRAGFRVAGPEYYRPFDMGFRLVRTL